MDRRKVDYIIVGQGIAGIWLAYELIKRGYSIQIFNKETANTSSLKAAGLYNPITGRKMVKTWLADDLFPTLEERYSEIEEFFRTKCIHSIPIYRPFATIEDKNDWSILPDPLMGGLVKEVEDQSLQYIDIKDELGGIIINYSGYIDLKRLITDSREIFINMGIYRPELFHNQNIEFAKDHIVYEDLEAKKILFCEGPNSNSFWENLPFKLVRGELIDIECGLNCNHIVNKGVFMIPKDGFFTVGSTYDHNHLTFEPQRSGVLNLKKRLGNLFSGMYKVIDQRAGVRPATFDRKPFIGLHPEKETLGIFNGFGTKGVSLTPFFAKQFVDFLEGKNKIASEANVERVF